MASTVPRAQKILKKKKKKNVELENECMNNSNAYQDTQQELNKC